MYFYPEKNIRFGTHAEIRRYFSSIELPNVIIDTDLASIGVFPLQSIPPLLDERYLIEDIGQEEQDGVWVVLWDSFLKPEPELSEMTVQKAVTVREQRNSFLSSKVDSINPMRWEMLTEEQRQDYREYRQALLDVPEQPGFPWEVQWPTQP